MLQSLINHFDRTQLKHCPDLDIGSNPVQKQIPTTYIPTTKQINNNIDPTFKIEID